MASIDWTDAVGAASLTNTWPAPADRFSGWTVLPSVMQDLAEALGDGVVHSFAFGPRYEATFALTQIPDSQQALVARLIRHLRAGGVVAVTTGDSASRTYPTCQMVPSAPPQVELDRAERQYTLTLTVRNVAASPSELLCVY